MNSNEGRQAKADAAAKQTELDPVKLLDGHNSTSVKLSFAILHRHGGVPPLSGVDNTWFWIVQDSGQNATVLLSGRGKLLHIKSTKTLGFKDVADRWPSAAGTKTDIYKFDGKSYRLHSTRWLETKP